MSDVLAARFAREGIATIEARNASRGDVLDAGLIVFTVARVRRNGDDTVWILDSTGALHLFGVVAILGHLGHDSAFLLGDR